MTRAGRRLAGPIAAAAGVLAFAAPALADDVSRAELREMAQRAASDPAALDDLERVERVDGEPVDLAQALAGAQDEELERRLELLADDPGRAGALDRGEAQRDARDILSERRFHETDVPRPFQSALEWLGEKLRPVRDALDRLARVLPGGRSTLWLVLAGIVVLVAALVASRVATRRAARVPEPGGGPRRTESADPQRLEREADAAERGGDLERALRLLFRAGLLRLHRARAIVVPDSLTSGELRRRLRSRDFDSVAATFDEVVYGGRSAEPPDVQASREAWARVLREAGAR